MHKGLYRYLILFFAVVAAGSVYATSIQMSIITNLQLNNQLVDPKANAFLLAGQTGSLTFFIPDDPSIVSWRCGLAADGLILDSISPTPISSMPTGYTFGATQRIEFLFHAGAFERGDILVSCEATNSQGLSISDYAIFRVRQSVNYQPIATGDGATPVPTVRAYP